MKRLCLFILPFIYCQLFAQSDYFSMLEALDVNGTSLSESKDVPMTKDDVSLAEERELEMAHLPSSVWNMWEFMEQYNENDKVVKYMNSFSAANINGCSGVMISPHIFMTAAHCGGPDHAVRTVSFYRIDEDASPSAQSQVVETYRARSLPWQAFYNPDGDMMLWWLEEGTDGIAPGIKYGYMEISPERVSVGDDAYSIWKNPSANLPSTLLYSQATATAVGSVPGGNPPLYFTSYDMFTESGASGSPVIGTGKHQHQIIGVTATGNSSFRNAADTYFMVERFDSDSNKVLDAIEYDWLFTRPYENFQRLEVNTPLQRSQWRLAPGGSPSELTHDPGFWVARVNKLGDSFWHSTARFKPNTSYRISMLVYGRTASYAPSYIRLVDGFANTAAAFQFQPVNGRWTQITGRITTPSGSDFRVYVGQGGNGSYDVLSISITEESPTASYNFETGTHRKAFEYQNAYPTSWGLQGSNDFSAVIQGPSPTPSTNPTDITWNLRNRYIGLEANTAYEVTFDAKHVDGALNKDLFMKIEDINGVAEELFTWKFTQHGENNSHTVNFTTHHMRSGIVFGAYDETRYLVDNISIRKTSSSPAPCTPSFQISSNYPGRDNTTPQATFDSDVSSFFKSSYNDWQHVQISFGCVLEVSSIRRMMTRDGDNSNGHRGGQGEAVSYSLDGKHWINITGAISSGWEQYNNYRPHAWHSINYGWSEVLRFDNPIYARYIRYQWDGNNDALNEIDIEYNDGQTNELRSSYLENYFDLTDAEQSVSLKNAVLGGVNFSVSPNPSGEFFVLHLENAEDRKNYILTITDHSAKVIREVSAYHLQQYDMSDLPSGLYMLHLKQHGEHIQSIKWVKTD